MQAVLIGVDQLLRNPRRTSATATPVQTGTLRRAKQNNSPPPAWKALGASKREAGVLLTRLAGGERHIIGGRGGGGLVGTAVRPPGGRLGLRIAGVPNTETDIPGNW